MNLLDYEKLTGYKPVPGERCPECKMTCGPGGPDHSTTCPVVTKLWQGENGLPASIPQHQLELGANPIFQAWFTKLSGRLFSEPVPVVVPAPPTT